MSPESAWLLAYLNSIHPQGVNTVSPLPVPDYLKREVKLVQMNGLVRRGWAHEPVNGLFYITEAGCEAVKKLPSVEI